MSTETKKEVSSTGSKVKKIFLYLFVYPVSLVLILLIGYATFFEEQIGKMVIKGINSQLKTELEVESARLSLVRNFPQAAVSLNNVRIKGVNVSAEEQDLLNVENLTLKCSILGLLLGEYNFKSINVENGSLYIKNNKLGQQNYDVMKGSEQEEEETNDDSGFDLSLNNTTFSNVELRYKDEQVLQDVKLYIESAYFEGDFNQENFQMLSYAELKSRYIEIGNERYLEDKLLAYDAFIGIDNVEHRFNFENIKLIVESNQFETNGYLQNREEGTFFDMDFHTSKAKLNSLIKLLPQSYVKALGGFESHADLYFDISLDGLLNARQRPAIDLKFGLKDGRVDHPDMDGDLNKVGFDISFTNGDGKRDASNLFTVKNFQGYFKGEKFDMNCTIKGLENPLVDMDFNGSIPFNAVSGMLGEHYQNGQGYIDIKNVKLQGYYKDMLNPQGIQRVRLEGTMAVDKLSIDVYDIPFSVASGSFILKNSLFRVSGLNMQTPNNQIQFDGSIRNVLPVLLADSVNSKHAELLFEANLNATQIDVDELLALGGPTVEEEISASDSLAQDSAKQEKIEQRAYTFDFIRGNFHTKVNQFKYGKIEASNCAGKLRMADNKLDLIGLSLEAMQGRFELNSRLYITEKPHLEVFLDLNQVNVQKLFEQTDNVGQSFLTDQNIRGLMNSLVKIEAFWDEYGNFDMNALRVIADVHIEQGELIDFEMFESFSSLIKIQDLKHIRFTKLENQFKIEQGVFYMPAMFIQSNALNLLISGKHSFDQDMDYKLKINAGQVLMNKFKKYDKKLKPQKARKRGLFNIYAHIYGNLDREDYQVKVGKKNVKQYLEQELANGLPKLTNTLSLDFQQTKQMVGNQTPSAVAVKPLNEPLDWQDIPAFE